MKYLRAISRLIIGLTFIFSGFVKIIDPVGAGLIIEEYFKIVGLGQWHFLYQTIGVMLSGAELLIGISVLLGIRMRYSSKAAFWFMAFFTVVTLILTLFNPITDCGCFGEAIKLTNLETFLKNLVLMLFATILYLQRERFVPIAPAVWEWGFAGVYGIMIIFLSLYSYRHLPLIDFMEFKVGTDIASRLENLSNKADGPEFETELIYSKDGKNYRFTIDHLPDSTYTFVDSHTKEINRGGFNKPMDFAISDSENNYVTDSLLSIKGPLFFVSLPFADDVGNKRIKRFMRLTDTLKSLSVPVVLLSGSEISLASEITKESGVDLEIYHTDYKTLLTLNRSNGGVIYLYDGIIIKKWSSAGTPTEKIAELLKGDPELLAAKSSINEQLTAEITAFVILLMIVIMRYICRIIYIHKHSESDWIAQTQNQNENTGE